MASERVISENNKLRDCESPRSALANPPYTNNIIYTCVSVAWNLSYKYPVLCVNPTFYRVWILCNGIYLNVHNQRQTCHTDTQHKYQHNSSIFIQNISELITLKSVRINRNYVDTRSSEIITLNLL